MGQDGVAEEPHRLGRVVVGGGCSHGQVTQAVPAELLGLDRAGLRDAVGEEQDEVARLETGLGELRFVCAVRVGQ